MTDRNPDMKLAASVLDWRANIVGPVDSPWDTISLALEMRRRFRDFCDQTRHELNLSGDDRSFLVLIAGAMLAEKRATDPS